MIKMIAIDLDGTLLNDEGDVSDYSLAVLKKCKSRGIKIAIVTARYLKHAERIIKLVNPDLTVTCLGARVINNKFEVIYNRSISSETADNLAEEFLHDTEFAYFSVTTEKNMYVRIKRPPSHPDYSFREEYDFSKPLLQESYMIGIDCLNHEKLARLEEKYKECKLLKFFPSTRSIFVHKEAGKLTALKVIAEMENIGIHEIAAFGDDYPDTGMIEECGIGIAMGNAIDELKAIAGHVCQNNNDDGVARWIEEHILTEGGKV